MRPKLLPPVSRLIAGTSLNDVELNALVEHIDKRGSLTETFSKQWSIGIAPAQWNMIRSEAHVLRGLHIHWRHDEYFCLIQGHCLFGLYDARPESPTYQHSALYELSEKDLKALVFPTGVIHGLYTYSPSTLIQAVSECYSDFADDDNFGCRWDDPALNIPWGISDPVLSDQAAGYPSLSVLLSRSAKT